jgi:cyclohexadienyl dehydratase
MVGRASQALLALGVMVAMALTPIAAFAQAKLDEIIQRGTLRVGLTGDYKPFSLRAADGTIDGIDFDMAKTLAQSLGVKLEIVPTTWPTLMGDLTADKFDIVMGGITITLARARTAYFSTPVMGSGKTPIVRCADVAKYQTIADINRPDVRVIVNPGGTNEKFDKANFPDAKIVMFPDNAKIFDELAAGHADVMVTDSIETRVQHKLHPDLCPVHPDAPFDHSELGYMMPRDIGWKLYVDLWLHQAQDLGTWKAAVSRQLD